MVFNRTSLALVFLALVNTTASADTSPQLKISVASMVPGCTTPDRLMAFLKSRNPNLDPRFEKIATTYRQFGAELKIRWDYAFFQMMVETSHLSFARNGQHESVQPQQNNFAGLGAPGPNHPGESFPSIEHGVKAHLQHLAMYAGDHVDAPVAERTRKVQEWGTLKAWHKGLKHPVTIADLTRKWSPHHSYGDSVEALAEGFATSHCTGPQSAQAVAPATAAPLTVTTTAPAPKMAAIASPQPAVPKASWAGGVSVTAPAPAPAAAAPAPSVGAELARLANERARAEGDTSRWSLGAGIRSATEPAPPTPRAQPTFPWEATTIAAPPKNERPVATAAEKPSPNAKSLPAADKCRVFTASYGGNKSVIIHQVANQYNNYTVLEISDVDENHEVNAFIDAYARNGRKIGSYRNQPEALDEAFKLCPEG